MKAGSSPTDEKKIIKQKEKENNQIKGETMKKTEKNSQTGKELIPKSENPIIVKISDDVIEAIAAISEMIALWVKIVETGFLAKR